MLGLVYSNNPVFSIFQEDKGVEVLLSFVKLNMEFYRKFFN